VPAQSLDAPSLAYRFGHQQVGGAQATRLKHRES